MFEEVKRLGRHFLTYVWGCLTGLSTIVDYLILKVVNGKIGMLSIVLVDSFVITRSRFHQDYSHLERQRSMISAYIFAILFWKCKVGCGFWWSTHKLLSGFHRLCKSLHALVAIFCKFTILCATTLRLTAITLCIS